MVKQTKKYSKGSTFTINRLEDWSDGLISRKAFRYDSKIYDLANDLKAGNCLHEFNINLTHSWASDKELNYLAQALTYGNVPSGTVIICTGIKHFNGCYQYSQNDLSKLCRNLVLPFAQAIATGRFASNVTLMFDRNNIGDEEVLILSKALKSGKAPTNLTIHLNDNDISDKGLLYLIDALRSGKCPKYLSICLEDNPKITNAGYLNFTEAAETDEFPSSFKFMLDIPEQLLPRLQSALVKTYYEKLFAILHCIHGSEMAMPLEPLISIIDFLMDEDFLKKSGASEKIIYGLRVKSKLIVPKDGLASVGIFAIGSASNSEKSKLQNQQLLLNNLIKQFGEIKKIETQKDELKIFIDCDLVRNLFKEFVQALGINTTFLAKKNCLVIKGKENLELFMDIIGKMGSSLLFKEEESKSSWCSTM